MTKAVSSLALIFTHELTKLAADVGAKTIKVSIISESKSVSLSTRDGHYLFIRKCFYSGRVRLIRFTLSVFW